MGSKEGRMVKNGNSIAASRHLSDHLLSPTLDRGHRTPGISATSTAENLSEYANRQSDEELAGQGHRWRTGESTFGLLSAPTLPFDASRKLKSASLSREEWDSSSKSLGQASRRGDAIDQILASAKPIKSQHFNYPFLLVQCLTIGACVALLFCGHQGSITVYQSGNAITTTTMGFMIGLVVQAALFSPLELGRRISQIWFGQRLMRQGMRCREMITAWSAIYSNSYRGIEDGVYGFGPISGFLLILYFGEIVVLGTLGSLYYSRAIWVDVASGNASLYTLPQVPVIDYNEAYDVSQRVALTLGRLLTPLAQEGLVVPGSSTVDCQGNGCEGNITLVLSQLGLPFLATLGGRIPSSVQWADLKPGELVRGELTTLNTKVSCKAHPFGYSTIDDAFYLYTSVEGMSAGYPLFPWSFQSPSFMSPTLQLVYLAGGDYMVDPVISESSGSLYVGVMGLNLEKEINRMGSLQEGDRLASTALCKIDLAVGTSDTQIRIQNVSPSRVVSVESAQPIQPLVPYSLANGTSGYAIAHYLNQLFSYYTCDILSCNVYSTEPPPFVSMLGLANSTQGETSLEIDYEHQLEVITSALTRMVAASVAVYSVPSDLEKHNSENPLVSYSKLLVLSNTFAAKIFTNLACNCILIMGASCSILLIALHIFTILVGRRGPKGSRYWNTFGPMYWMTDSVYVLFKALQQSQVGNALPSLNKAHPAAMRKAVGGDARVSAQIDASGELVVDLSYSDYAPNTKRGTRSGKREAEHVER
ncbi:hypothetical protein DFS34DRAFT_652043 [Phlyctochytrium arcticum]|nr:hypothetical protein DFS34DRAFT_652043 [Phlyctochytrium arcticum]